MRRFVVPEDYFNPFDILHMSRHYDAHVVPDVTAELRDEIVKILDAGAFDPHDGGVYVQTAGPRFETKAEVRFFAQFGVRRCRRMNATTSSGWVGRLLTSWSLVLLGVITIIYCAGPHWYDRRE